jgi:hypothetical protein
MQPHPNLKQVSRTAAVAPYQRPPLTNACLGDKTVAFKLVERAMATVLIEERRDGRSRFARDPRPGGGADGRTRPRHRRFTEITFDIDPRFQKLCQEKPKTADK